jgi:hypothetical protein
MKDVTEMPTRPTLDAAPGRLLKLMTAIARSVPIRAQMAKVGYDAKAAREGWDRLHRATGYHDVPELDVPLVDERVRDAVVALDAWDDTFFARADAVLADDFRDQHAFLFAGGLRSEAGPASMLGVRTFLDRLDALDRGRPDSADADRAALAELERVGLDAAERARARDLLATAETLGPVVEGAPRDDSDHEAALYEVWRWHRRWSQLAHTVIKRRDHLVQMGLATRHKPEDKGGQPS